MLNRLMVEEKGFTLVELLVTLSILAVLFGITTLTLSGVNTSAQGTVCDAETAIVQSAMDIYTAEGNSITITGTDTQISPSDGEFANYLRRTTVGYYTWTDADDLSQVSCPDAP